MLMRIRLALLIGGGVLTFLGFQEYQVAAGTSTEPEGVDLAEVEASGAPENPHIEIGPHWAVYGGSVYEYRQGRFETGDPEGSTKVTHTYYPIVSDSHPFIQALAEVEDRYGTLADVPDEELPELRGGIAVVVKTRAFGTIDEIPDGFAREESIRGLVINRISSLDSEERRLLTESFPDLDVDQLAILEQNREPASPQRSLGMMGGGVLLSLAGLGWLLRHYLGGRAA